MKTLFLDVNIRESKQVQVDGADGEADGLEWWRWIYDEDNDDADDDHTTAGLLADTVPPTVAEKLKNWFIKCTNV